MIPKIIHYTWFSGDEYPKTIKKCIDSWHKLLPDYELRLWDMESIKNIDSVYLKEAIQMKKWAFASDMVRLYAIYHNGGIYLDTDVEVLQSFDKFLNNKAFFGKEHAIHRPIVRDRIYSNCLTAHCFGAEKEHVFIKDCLDYYSDRHFIITNNTHLPEYLRLNMVLAPYIQYEIALTYGYDPHPFHQTIQQLENGLVIYPTEYFDPGRVTKQSACIHYAAGTWMNDKYAAKINNSRLKKWIYYPTSYILSKFNLLIHSV
ncbi:MAG: glycosyl transferase [Alphaproteobacteria bacterium]|nr:glycosyl transferase [Alphaproteobacteria bacterium]